MDLQTKINKLKERSLDKLKKSASDKFKNATESSIGRKLRKAALFGLLTTLGTSSSFGQDTQDKSDSSLKNNQTENAVAIDKASDCAYYYQDVTLDAHSPIYQIYQVEEDRAFYSSYLNGGAGGIVFTNFQISDADAFGNANNTNPEKFTQALENFASYANSLGYDGEIKSLQDVSDCLTSFADIFQKTGKKKDNYRSQRLQECSSDNGLQKALSVKKYVEETNAANLKSKQHEEAHADNGEYMKKINTGEILLTPGGIYMARMADELQAHIKGKDIPPTTDELEGWFAQFGANYQERYSSDLRNDVSYNRLFAYGLNEERGEQRLSAQINNTLIDKGTHFSLNGAETAEGFVFFGEKDVSSVKMKNGKVLHLNCLTDANGNVLLDADGKKIPAKFLYNDGNFQVAVQKNILTTKDMDKNQDDALKHILRNLEPSAQKMVMDVLNKHCKEYAKGLTENLLSNTASLMEMRAQTSKENVAADMQYIVEKRAKTSQEVTERELAGKNLRLMNDTTFQATVDMFNQGR